MNDALMKIIYSNKKVDEYVEICENLQLQRTIACNDSLDLQVRARANAHVFVLRHLQGCYQLELLQTDLKELTAPNYFSI